MKGTRNILLGTLVLAGLGCTEVTEEQVVNTDMLSPSKQLLRLSVDLRGIHPGQAELQAIENNPALYEDYVDRYLEDPRMLERMREIFNYRYLMRVGTTYNMNAYNFSSTEVAGAIDNEALRLLTRIMSSTCPIRKS